MDLQGDTKKRTHSNISEISASSPLLQPTKLVRMNTSNIEDQPSPNDSLMDVIHNPEVRFKNLEDKVDEVLSLLKVQTVQTGLDVHQLQDENRKLKLRLQESEGTVARLSKKVSSLELTVEDMKIHQMKHNLIFHNIPEKQDEDCYTVINCFFTDVLKVPDHLFFSKNNLSGEVRVDIAHRIGQRKAKPRPLVVSFVTRRGRDIILSQAKNLKSTPYAVTEQLPPSVRERRTAQIPSLIKLRNEAKADGKKRDIRLIKDKLIVDSKVNSDSFHKSPIDFTLPVQDSVDIANLTHSTVLSEKGSLFQGHIYPIHSLDQGSQALRAIMQDPVFAKSDHILYAYEYVDGDGQLASGYYDDGEWTGSQILSEVLRQRNVNNAILIVTRVHGGTNLGKARFDLIRRVAADALDKFTDHKIE